MEQSEQLGMAKAGKPQVVLLSRNPEVGYIYWEWPGAEANDQNPATLRFLVRGQGGDFEEVQRFEVVDALGGQFIQFSRPGAPHRCELAWSGRVCRSEVVSAPRREAAEEPAAFVQVHWTSDGLDVEPKAHEHATHGRFPAATVKAGSSHTAAGSSHTVPGRGRG